MIEIASLQPHDPLPEGHSVVVMRRLDEDAPQGTAIEIIVTNPDKSERTFFARHPDGTAMAWDEALAIGRARAEAEGLTRIWSIDRTAGPREQEILSHHGDHTVNMATLADTDEEDGVTGTDMRDRGNDGAPRRF